MQRWRFLVVRDPKVKETVGALYKRAWDEQVAPRYRAGEPAPGTSRERFERMLAAAEYLANHIHEAPVWIVPCLEGAAPTRTSGSSIYPAVQNRSYKLALEPDGSPLFHAAGGGSPRPRRDIDDALFAVREGGRGCTRVAAQRAFLCLAPDRRPYGQVWTRPSCPSRRSRLWGPLGSGLPGSVAAYPPFHDRSRV